MRLNWQSTNLMMMPMKMTEAHLIPAHICQMLEMHYQTHSDAQIARLMPQWVHPAKIRQMRRALGLNRTPEQEAEIVRKSRPTLFQVGHASPLRRPIGSVLKRADGYWYIQTETGPQRYHRWLWEKENGPVPSGHVLIFLARIRKWENLRTAHLKLITKQELLQRNHKPEVWKKSRAKGWKRWREERLQKLAELAPEIESLFLERQQCQALVNEFHQDRQLNPGIVKTTDVHRAECRLRQIKVELSRKLVAYYKAKPVRSCNPAFDSFPDF